MKPIFIILFTILYSQAFPPSYLIKTAFVPQAPEKKWDEPWQDACEEAALLTANYYYKSETPNTSTIVSDLQAIFKYENSQNWSDDVNIIQMAQISKELFHLQTKIIDNPTINQLKAEISQSHPIIIPANGKTLFKENTHFKSGGPWYHNLALIGYDDSKKQFIVHDVGTQFGAYYRYSYSLLLQSIHDFPASGKKEDIDSGEKRVLVLLK